MSKKEEEAAALAEHLEHLSASMDDVVAMLTVHHDEGGDINPEALPKAQHLHQSLKDVIKALHKHDHLAMSADDVWAALTVKHKEHDSGVS